MKSRIFLSLFLVFNYILCLASVAYAIGINNFSSGYAFPSNGHNFIYESLIAAITGGVLTSGAFFFFLRRMVNQYDMRHDRTEQVINSLQAQIYTFETIITDKLHDKSDDLHHELSTNLTEATKVIIDTLDSLRDTIQELVTDLTVLKTEHNKCDYKSGDINLLKNELENISNILDRKFKR